MKRQQFLHGNLEGNDVDIETSLKEYGLAWIVQGDEVLFYYGIDFIEGEHFRFDFCSFPAYMDIISEYDWVDFADIYSFTGMTAAEWEEQPLTSKISDLVSYYGYENIFGSSYWSSLSYQGIWFAGKN